MVNIFGIVHIMAILKVCYMCMLHSRFNKEAFSHEVICCVHLKNYDGFHACHSICGLYIGCVSKHFDFVTFMHYMKIPF